MDFFIQTAQAQQGAPQGDSTSFIIMMVLMFAAFYFLLIRPQQKKQKAHAELVAGLKVGDEVMTAGGILGKVTGVSDHYAIISIASNTEIKVQKGSVSMVLPKGTFDEA
ncbi:MAG: preprotein translocase subunit YajC [Gammaproteobacteria bacterium]|jgi:preprotein translocase subunit YajC|nr:preprotein translocase subunit YajC [Gammaproteobacteria bacterium]